MHKIQKDIQIIFCLSHSIAVIDTPKHKKHTTQVQTVTLAMCGEDIITKV